MFKWQPPNDSYQQDPNLQTWPSAASTSAPTKEKCPEQPIKSGLRWRWTNMKWKWIPQPGRAGHKRSAGQLTTVCRDTDEIPITPQWAIVDWWPKGEHFQDISRLQSGENTEYQSWSCHRALIYRKGRRHKIGPLTLTKIDFVHGGYMAPNFYFIHTEAWVMYCNRASASSRCSQVKTTEPMVST